MKYYRLQPDAETETKSFMAFGAFQTKDGSIVDDGEYAEGWNHTHDRLIATVVGEGKLAEMTLTSFGALLVSPPIADTLVEWSSTPRISGIVRVDIPGAEEHRLLVQLSTLPVIDAEKSEVVYWAEDDHRKDRAGKVRCIKKLVIAEPTFGKDIFRVAGAPHIVVVSERLREIFSQYPTLGVTFELLG